MFKLLGLPVLLFRAWELHSDNLLREYALACGPGYPYSLADVAVAKQARDSVSAALNGNEAEAANAATKTDVDVPLPQGTSADDFSTLQAVLEHANDLARRGEFLTMPGLPEIVGLRNWVCEEATGQGAGRTPRPWSLTSATTSTAPPAHWEGAADLPASGSWIVGDDQNRIVVASDAALALLGWSQDELAGQRILAVIPPALREAHVAAFTRATVTGEYHLLGQQLSVDAWTRSGKVVPVTLTLERRSGAGRGMFVAWLERRTVEEAGA